MNRTKIEWVKNPDGSQGYTWNPITGCLNHVNGLCNGGGFPCYAYKLANGRLKSRYLANKNTATDRYDEDSYPFYPRFWGDRLAEPMEHPEPMYPAKRKGIFVCDMSDLFGIGIPEIWAEQVMTTIKLCPYHRFYLLTKKPQNLIKWSPFPENAYIGVTATDTYMAVKGLQHLDGIKASKKFVSFEPLLSQTCITAASLSGIDWLIIGAQTNPYKPPEIEWVREIVNAADKAGIPVFLKDNLRPLLIPGDCSKPNYLTEDIFWASEKAKLRQEMPG